MSSNDTVQTSHFAEDNKDIKMDTADSERIRSNYTELLTRLNPQDVTDFLWQQQVLTTKDIELIQAAHTQAQKVFTFIAILRCKGKNGFTPFLEALKRNGYEELANKIENSFVVLIPRDEHRTELPHDEHDTESHTEMGESDRRNDEVKEELREQTELTRQMRKEIEQVRFTFS